MFLLFAGHCHYACGGINDYEGSFNTLKEAQDAAHALDEGGFPLKEWYQIVDKDTMEVVDKSKVQAYY